MPNKNDFFLSIDRGLKANENFYKKIYGYSVTDSAFRTRVTNKIVEIGRKEVIEEYNLWLSNYLEEVNLSMKEAAIWLRKEIDEEYERRVKEREWEQKESVQKKRTECWSKFGKMLNFK